MEELLSVLALIAIVAIVWVGYDFIEEKFNGIKDGFKRSERSDLYDMYMQDKEDK